MTRDARPSPRNGGERAQTEFVRLHCFHLCRCALGLCILGSFGRHRCPIPQPPQNDSGPLKDLARTRGHTPGCGLASGVPERRDARWSRLSYCEITGIVRRTGQQMVLGQIKRRQFITLLGGAAAAWPLAARAQQPARLPSVGYMGSATPATQGQWAAVFAQRLQELGWTEGRNVKIEVRWAEGRSERFAEIAAEFVALKVNVIVTSGGVVPTVKQATSTIPIVFAAALDPVASGYVASLARPGGNITGLSLQSTDTVGKRLGFLRELVPDLRRLAIMTNAGNPGNVLVMREAQGEAHVLGIELATSEIRRAEDIALAFHALKDNAQALYVVSSPLSTTNRVRINTLALGRRLPAIYDDREFVEVGGLISYGPDFTSIYRRAADYVDKILRGAKPGELPVEQPTKFDLVVNLTTAKALGLTVPDKLLAIADKVIE